MKRFLDLEFQFSIGDWIENKLIQTKLIHLPLKWGKLECV